MERRTRSLSVGELAQRAGVSVRTLHYYEELGLLAPGRTSSGHRRYGAAAIERLQQIRSLQQLNFSLARIAELLDHERQAPEQIVADHLVQVGLQRRALEQLEGRLRRLQDLLRRDRRKRKKDDSEAIEVLLQTLEAITMYEKHLTPEQLEQVNALHGAAAAEAGAEWQAALDGLRVEMDAGTDPSDAKVAALAARWHQAAATFMPPGDEAIHAGVMQALHDEPQARRDHGLDDALFAYLGRALAADQHAS